ncbi:MAG: hypothetical protein PHE83_17310 [Opitutaceae bacterium]|nr:hypothetical protein [Opitutaceae bacterium]
MAFFFLAAAAGYSHPAPYYLTRIWLPASSMFDSFCEELLTRYPRAEHARLLCSETPALRGLPSGAQVASAEETEFLLPERAFIEGENDLRQLIEDHEAEGALLFVDGDWWKIFPRSKKERLRELTLLALAKTG